MNINAKLGMAQLCVALLFTCCGICEETLSENDYKKISFQEMESGEVDASDGEKVRISGYLKKYANIMIAVYPKPPLAHPGGTQQTWGMEILDARLQEWDPPSPILVEVFGDYFKPNPRVNSFGALRNVRVIRFLEPAPTADASLEDRTESEVKD